MASTHSLLLFVMNQEEFADINLGLSVFLSRYQRLFCRKGERYGVISPADVAEILAFRDLQKKLSDLEFDCPTNSTSICDKVENQRKVIRQFIDGNPRVHDLHLLLQRVEVWCTKALAHTLLLTHLKETSSESDAFCWSALLNLPSSSYSSYFLPHVSGPPPPKTGFPFSSFFEKVQTADPSHTCSLLLPPNVYTWKEYYAYCHLVAKLPTDEARKSASNSPLTGNARLMKHVTYPKFHLNQSDLVALWIRSRRSTQARRHLYTLYKIVKHEVEDNTCYRAEYLGNHKYTQRKVISESRYIDELTKWAIINQVMVTNHVVVKAFRDFHQKKRPHGPDYTDGSGRSLKRSKPCNDDQLLSENQLQDLLFACQRFILRKFAYRNRDAVSILFFSDVDCMTNAAQIDFPVGKQAKELARLGVIKQIRNSLTSSDCTLPRIDRRIAMGKYARPMVSTRHEDRFHDAVMTLLKVLQESVARLKLDDSIFQNAVQDFDFFYRLQFIKKLKQYGVVAAARSLLNTSKEVDVTQLAAVLSELASPWVDKCLKCEKNLFEKTNKCNICARCNRGIHVSCSGGHGATLRLEDVTDAFKPLKSLHNIIIPKDLPHPDFRSGVENEITWEEKVLIIERSTLADGELQAIGLGIRQTEYCVSALESILSGGLLIDELDEKSTHPLLLDPVGFLVVSVSDDETYCGKASGFQEGDVIVAVELLELRNGEEELKYSRFTTYRFSELSLKDRVDLFRVTATKLRVFIERPSKNICEQSRRWTAEIRSRHEALMLLEKSNETAWFCSSCVDLRPQSAERHKKQGLKRKHMTGEAKLGKCLIRRMMMEFHSILFTNDDMQVTCGPERTPCAFFPSLRRLECMMDFILERSENSTSDETVQLSPAFYDNSTKLDWAVVALHSGPFDILCEGFSRIFEWSLSKKNLSTKKDEISYFMTAFLRLLTAWCLSTSELVPTALHTKKENMHYLLEASVPTLRYCQKCLVRTVPEWRYGECCGKCLKVSGEENLNSCVESAVKSYQINASFVGKTVFLIPGDPVLESILDRLRAASVAVEHMDRPIEFLIASCLPSSTDPSKQDARFHLLPLVNLNQLAFVQGRCNLRSVLTETNDPEEILMTWLHDGILDLTGILELNETQFHAKWKASEKISSAVYADIITHAHCTYMKPHGQQQSDTDYPDRAEILPCRAPGCECKFTTRHYGVDHCVLSHFLDDTLLSTSHELRKVFQLDEEEEGCKRTCFEHVTEDYKDATSAANDCRAILHVAVPEVVSSRRASLFYSDLYFENDDERVKFDNLYPLKVMTVSTRTTDADGTRNLRTIILRHGKDWNSNSSDSNYLGWGFEVLRLSGKKDLIIGRVHRISPAKDAGLSEGDLLISVNGTSWNKFESASTLTCALLSRRVDLITGHSAQHALARAVADLTSKRELPGPIVLVVAKPGLQPIRREMLPRKFNSDSPVIQMKNESRLSRRTSSSETSSVRPHDDSSEVVLVGVKKAPLVKPPSFSRQIELRRGATASSARFERSASFSAADFLPLFHAVVRADLANRCISWTDLYKPCSISIIFSRLEIATLIHAIRKQSPMLGVRMLCPRFDVILILDELKRITLSHRLDHVPQLSEIAWKLLQRYDYSRALREPKDGIVKFDDGKYKYRMPVCLLPIDRILEHILDPEGKLYGVNAMKAFACIHHLQPSSSFTPAPTEKVPNLEINGNSVVLTTTNTPLHQSQNENLEVPSLDMSSLLTETNVNSQNISVPKVDRNLSEKPAVDCAEQRHKSILEKREPAPAVRPMMLCNVPPETWDRRLVYSVNQMLSQGQNDGEAEFIGFVELPKGKANKDGKVPVVVFFASNVGMLSERKLAYFAPSELRLVGRNTNEHKIVLQWKNSLEPGKTWPSASNTGEDTIDCRLRGGGEIVEITRHEMHSPHVEKCGEKKAVGVSSEGCIQGMNFHEQEKGLLRELSSLGKLSVLGHLPDGQTVYWLPTDPDALYLSHPSFYSGNDQLRLSQQLTAESRFFRNVQSIADKLPEHALLYEPGTHACIWGCTSCKGDVPTLVSFASRADLLKHIASKHTLSQSPSRHYKMSCSVRYDHLSRINNKNDIRKVRDSALTAACSRNPLFARFGSPDFRSYAMQLHYSKYILMGSIKDLMIPLPQLDEAINLLLLGWRLCLLFDDPDSMRLCDEDLEMMVCHDGSLESNSSIGLDVEKQNSVHGAVGFCSVCECESESVLSGSCPKGMEVSESYRRGVGCGMITNHCYPKAELPMVQDSAVNSAKFMLISLVDRMPIALRKSSDTRNENSAVTPTPSFLPWSEFWSSESLQTWRDFVHESRNIQSLTQAFATMVASVEVDHLPKWWNEDGVGWSELHGVVAGAEHDSSLFLHLYVLDAAVAEYCSLAAVDQPRFLNDEVLMVMEKAQDPGSSAAISLEHAKQLQVEPYDGEYFEHCIHCQDGGELLCCEFCPAVAHLACINSSLRDPPEYFVCSSCAVDLATIRNIS